MGFDELSLSNKDVSKDYAELVYIYILILNECYCTNG